jgi:succinate dehydrogenase / fumarate reductase cytochrome b subunit
MEDPRMSAAAATHAVSTRDASFLLRRLHSLSGIVPIGAFLCFHLFENMQSQLGAEAYETHVVKAIWSIAPKEVFIPVIEFGLLFVPILFHSLYGFWIWYTGQSNASQYGYRRNWMYTMQRWSGLVAFLYMAFHVSVLRFAHGGLMKTEMTTFREVSEHLAPAGILIIYVIGSVAAAFHLGNGLYGFSQAWGLAVGRKAQRSVEFAGWLLFLGLSAAAVWSLAGFRAAHGL